MRKMSIALLSIVACLVAGTVHAATITVPDQYPTIQAGVDAAVDGDTVIVRGGAYTGEGDAVVTISGKSITLVSAHKGWDTACPLPSWLRDGYSIRQTRPS